MNKSDDTLLNEIGELLIRAMDNALSKEEFDRLGILLKSNPSAREYYYDILATFAGVDEIAVPSLDGPMDLVAWKAMADIERTAPTVILEKTKTPENVELEHVDKIVRKVNKVSLTVAITSLAALFLMIIFVNYVQFFSQEEVATLTDSVNAQWKDSSLTTARDTRLAARQGMMILERGLVKLQFDSNAKVIIEGPAKFEITTGDQIQLYLGRIYATVPPEAVGFTVKTFNSKIVDLGTEFGVQVDAVGNTELHVLKGKTSLISGNLNKISTMLTGGAARKIAGVEAALSDIQCDRDRFARYINSNSHLIWRGESIQLADIVGNGSGLGTGTPNIGINPITGQIGKVEIQDRTASNAYQTLTQNPFIDGVFVPNGKTPQLVSSQGHVFEECPPTCGNFYMEISNTPLNSWAVPQQNKSNMTMNPFLLLHANTGITFDLNAIRSQLSNLKISRFQSQLHISDMAPNRPNCDFWILVDGKVLYSKRNVTQLDFLDYVVIELNSNDHFLTLAVTDGQDPENRIMPDGSIMKSINSDWCVFADPVLILE
jgi:cell division protein FtsL